jgi:hypothetical protein
MYTHIHTHTHPACRRLTAFPPDIKHPSPLKITAMPLALALARALAMHIFLVCAVKEQPRAQACTHVRVCALALALVFEVLCTFLVCVCVCACVCVSVCASVCEHLACTRISTTTAHPTSIKHKASTPTSTATAPPISLKHKGLHHHYHAINIEHKHKTRPHSTHPPSGKCDMSTFGASAFIASKEA